MHLQGLPKEEVVENDEKCTAKRQQKGRISEGPPRFPDGITSVSEHATTQGDQVGVDRCDRATERSQVRRYRV